MMLFVTSVLHVAGKGEVETSLSKEVENGKTQYELETQVNGHNRDLLIDPAGKVLEVEEGVEIATLPAAAQAGVKNSLGTVKLLLESVTRDGVLSRNERPLGIKSQL